MTLRYTPYTLEFKYPFRIAINTRIETPIVITEIECDGLIGYGEASMPPYLGEDQQTASDFLEQASKIIGEYKTPLDIEIIMARIDAVRIKNTAAKASIDIALHDLKGKLENKPCYSYWNLQKENTPFTSVTIAIDKPEIIIKKIEEVVAFPILKIKLGSEDDKKIIRTIRSCTDKPLSVDVNQGWKTKEQALEMIYWLRDNNILFVEQPLLKNDFSGSAWLAERSPLPIIADESMQRLHDLETVKNCFHGINIKLMKCTGLTEAYKIIIAARKNKLKVLLGCMSETSCAISAAAQLSPLADWADLDGPLLIKNDLFEGVKFVNGKITLNDLPGIGVKKLREEKK
ncbi:MAG: dipeptide epimerase [Bacteroidia bacterium]|nr:dipeptide epimerase [Bacteroidia bacterium]